MSFVDDLKPSDTIQILPDLAAAMLPVGTILEAISDDIAVVVYKVTDVEWTITGLALSCSNEQIANLTTNGGNRIEWRVVRVGEDVR